MITYFIRVQPCKVNMIMPILQMKKTDVVT